MTGGGALPGFGKDLPHCRNNKHCMGQVTSGTTMVDPDPGRDNIPDGGNPIVVAACSQACTRTTGVPDHMWKKC